VPVNTDVLYLRHRPQTLEDMVGNAEACQLIQSKVDSGKVPHAWLFTGEPGCGKTTLARILSRMLGVSLDSNPYDFYELNAADARGIDTMREIRDRMLTAPIGPCKVFLIDEVQQLTGAAQSSILKILEDTPQHAYFFLCTSVPAKVQKAIRTRCTPVEVRLLTRAELDGLIARVWVAEDRDVALLTDAVLDALYGASEGSPRMALTLLDKCLDLSSAEAIVDEIQRGDSKRAAIELCRILMEPAKSGGGGKAWKAAMDVLKGVDEEPETLRRMVLAYATTVLIGGSRLAPQAYFLIRAFEGHLFDSGRAGLIAACWDVLQSNK